MVGPGLVFSEGGEPSGSMVLSVLRTPQVKRPQPEVIPATHMKTVPLIIGSVKNLCWLISECSERPGPEVRTNSVSYGCASAQTRELSDTTRVYQLA